MRLDGPKPRSDYAEHVSHLGDACAFCAAEDGLGIKDFTHWTWTFAAFPYRKHHTLIVPKRHILTFGELQAPELSELQQILDHVETVYREKGIVRDDSEFGDQLFVSWRTRSPKEQERKKPVAHFHIHAYPRFNQGADIFLDDHAFDIDTGLLRN